MDTSNVKLQMPLVGIKADQKRNADKLKKLTKAQLAVVVLHLVLWLAFEQFKYHLSYLAIFPWTMIFVSSSLIALRSTVTRSQIKTYYYLALFISLLMYLYSILVIVWIIHEFEKIQFFDSYTLELGVSSANTGLFMASAVLCEQILYGKTSSNEDQPDDVKQESGESYQLFMMQPMKNGSDMQPIQNGTDGQPAANQVLVMYPVKNQTTAVKPKQNTEVVQSQQAQKEI